MADTTSTLDGEISSVWSSVSQAAAVADCIPMVIGATGGTGSSSLDDRLMALAGAVIDLLAQARQHIELAEARLHAPPSNAAS